MPRVEQQAHDFHLKQFIRKARSPVCDISSTAATYYFCYFDEPAVIRAVNVIYNADADASNHGSIKVGIFDYSADSHDDDYILTTKAMTGDETAGDIERYTKSADQLANTEVAASDVATVTWVQDASETAEVIVEIEYVENVNA